MLHHVTVRVERDERAGAPQPRHAVHRRRPRRGHGGGDAGEEARDYGQGRRVIYRRFSDTDGTRFWLIPELHLGLAVERWHHIHADQPLKSWDRLSMDWASHMSFLTCSHQRCQDLHSTH